MLRPYHVHLLFLCFLSTYPSFTFTAAASARIIRSEDASYMLANNWQQDDKKKEKKPGKPEQQAEVKQVPKAKKQNVPAKVKTEVNVKPKVIRPKIKKH